ncbi:hypothetical protein NKJ35_23220 [Mesorhizobium sp. M0136]|uniref:hypothetical protein n=1 Tax=Mesorhizobium sp. M0136 TaxID=2956890 RepID=UPI003335FF42
MPFICAGGVLFVVRLSQDRSFENGFRHRKKCPGPEMVPGWSNSRTSVNDFPSGIAQKQRAPSGFWQAIARLLLSDLPARRSPPRVSASVANQKIDTARKEVYKNFVDVCLTDFCYPRAKARL